MPYHPVFKHCTADRERCLSDEVTSRVSARALQGVRSVHAAVGSARLSTMCVCVLLPARGPSGVGDDVGAGTAIIARPFRRLGQGVDCIRCGGLQLYLSVALWPAAALQCELRPHDHRKLGIYVWDNPAETLPKDTAERHRAETPSERHCKDTFFLSLLTVAACSQADEHSMVRVGCYSSHQDRGPGHTHSHLGCLFI